MAFTVEENFEHYDSVRYPWHEWLDGQCWVLIQGEDFQGSVRNFQQMFHRVVRRLYGLDVRIRTKTWKDPEGNRTGIKVQRTVDRNGVFSDHG